MIVLPEMIVITLVEHFYISRTMRLLYLCQKRFSDILFIPLCQLGQFFLPLLVFLPVFIDITELFQ